MRVLDEPIYPALPAAFRDTVAVGFGLVPLGLAFGVLMVQSGFAWWWTPLFSVLIYAGSLEFLAIGLLVAVTPLASIAATALLVNFRHVFYALSFPLHKVRGKWARAYAMYALTDEAYALTATRTPGSLSSARILWTQALCQTYWVTGGVVGALAGSLLPGEIPGVGFALTALFVVLTIDAQRVSRDIPTPILAFLCALVALVAVPRDFMLVAAMSLFVATLLVRFAWGRRQASNVAEPEVTDAQ